MVEVILVHFVKDCFLKYNLQRRMDYNISLGFLPERNCPDSKNLDLLKIAKSGIFETVNFVQTGRFLMVL